MLSIRKVEFLQKLFSDIRRYELTPRMVPNQSVGYKEGIQAGTDKNINMLVVGLKT